MPLPNEQRLAVIARILIVISILTALGIATYRGGMVIPGWGGY